MKMVCWLGEEHQASYRQSEAENMFFRYKKLFGDALNARNENSRLVESVIACNILNQFRLLGKPKYELAG